MIAQHVLMEMLVLPRADVMMDIMTVMTAIRSYEQVDHHPDRHVMATPLTTDFIVR